MFLRFGVNKLFWPLICVHPELLWVEIEATAVEENFGLDLFSIAEVTNATLERHDRKRPVNRMLQGSDLPQKFVPAL